MSKLYAYLLALIVLLLGCGGGGGGGAAVVTTPAQKTATVEFATTTTNTGVVLKAVYIVVRLPAGVTVATKPGTTEISDVVLKGVNSAQLQSSSYIAADNEVRIPVITSTIISGFPVGVFARLTCDVAPGKTMTESQFSSLTPVVFQATGANGVDLTDPVNSNPPVAPKISATFN